MQIVKKVSEEFSGMRLDKASSIIFEDFSRTQLKKWIIEGRILLNNELASPKETVHTDDEIQINPISEIKTSWEPEEIHFEVIKEENEETGVSELLDSQSVVEDQIKLQIRIIASGSRA